MTTYLSLDSLSPAMFPSSGVIRCSALTPELVKARMEKVEVLHVQAPNIHIANAVRQRYNIALPYSGASPGSIALRPGDELFSAQPGSLEFVRYRIPVRVDVCAPFGVPQCVFDEIIDHMHAIALWQRGGILKTYKELVGDLREEIAELKAAEAPVDAWLEAADILYKSCCLYYIDGGNAGFFLDDNFFLEDDDDNAGLDARIAMINAGIASYPLDPRIIDIMLVKYARRASGEGKDLAVERGVAMPLIGHQ